MKSHGQAIEYSDPKKTSHGRRRTTTIFWGVLHGCGRKKNAKATNEVERKAYVDKIRRQQLKLNVDKNTSSLATYSGCLHPVLRPITVVEANRLRVGDTFPDINTLKLRVAEEANLRGISFHTTRSENTSAQMLRVQVCG